MESETKKLCGSESAETFSSTFDVKLKRFFEKNEEGPVGKVAINGNIIRDPSTNSTNCLWM